MHPRYFELLNFQHFILYLLPALIALLVFASALGYMHFRGRDDKEDDDAVHYVFAGGIKEQNKPFPLVLILVIAGTVIWGFGYIIVSGLLERVI
jgi:hypothetical protein